MERAEDMHIAHRWKSVLIACAMLAAIGIGASLPKDAVAATSACPAAPVGVSQLGLNEVNGVVRLSQQSFTSATLPTLAWGRTCMEPGASNLDLYLIRGSSPSSVYVVSVDEGALEVAVVEIGGGGSVLLYSAASSLPRTLQLNEAVRVNIGDQLVISNAYVTVSNSSASRTMISASALLTGVSETGCTRNCWIP